MKHLFGILILIFILQSCEEKVEVSSINRVNWDKRAIEYEQTDSMINGSTYLSIYSQIYRQTEHGKYNLTVTVSMRNINKSDTVFINKATYYNTKGESIRSYFEKSIFIAPMETVEIVIDEVDEEGGTGANFVFDWTMKSNSNEPFFEGIMISTSGQQGLSFTTQGKRLN